MVSPGTRQKDNLTESPHEEHSLTESPIQKRTDSQKAHMHCCLSLHICVQHSIAESPLLHENPPAQPHRKPNPKGDKPTECPHALLLSILLGPR